MSRTAYQICVIGTNGTGKTTFCENLINKKNEQGQKALIVTNHAGEWNYVTEIDITDKEFLTFTGVRKTIMTDKLFPYLKNFSRGILVFDDARRYIKPALNESLEDILISRRQTMTDIISVAHSFKQMPPGFFPFASHFALFKTTESARTRSGLLPDVNEILKIQTEINTKAKENPHYYKIITL